MNCSGSITSQGFNISDDYSCAFNQPGDHKNVDPILGPLADNGGSMLTHLHQDGSSTIDVGQCIDGLITDQRGISRHQEAACDIGAVEVKKALPSPPPTPSPNVQIFLPLIIR
jgi:hypothetical protein